MSATLVDELATVFDRLSHENLVLVQDALSLLGEEVRRANRWTTVECEMEEQRRTAFRRVMVMKLAIGRVLQPPN